MRKASMTRRQFHRTALGLTAGVVASHPAAGTASAATLRTSSLAAPRTAPQAVPLASAPIVFFSKHLAELSWANLGTAVQTMGFAGVDLTVRPGGHVLPERVTDDLPKAVSAIRDSGTTVRMLTTGLTRADDPAARPTFAAADRVNIRLLKAGYYRYAFDDVRAELAEAVRSFGALAALAGEAGVTLAYHNHSGYIGAPVWDALEMVEPLPAAHAAYYFDIRHAVVEGGHAGWRVSTQLVAPRLRMLAAKDFYWDRRADGRWQVVDCPLGEGMVDWPAFFAEIARTSFDGPISVHVEYDPGGRTPVERTERMMDAAARDRARLAEWMREAAAGAGR